jgi:hypothetical protein
MGLKMVAPGRVELPTFGLGNRCSIHLSYGAVCCDLKRFYTETAVSLPRVWSSLERKATGHCAAVEAEPVTGDAKAIVIFQLLSASPNRRWKRTTIELNQCSGS